MSVFINSFLAGLALPFIAYLVKKTIIDKLFLKSEKEIIIKDNDKKIMTLSVQNTSEIDKKIEKQITNRVTLEKEIQKTLERFARENSILNITVSKNKDYDYILKNDKQMIAIELKSSIDAHRERNIYNLKKKSNSNIDMILINNHKHIKKKVTNQISASPDITLISTDNIKLINKNLENTLRSKVFKFI